MYLDLTEHIERPRFENALLMSLLLVLFQALEKYRVSTTYAVH
jgi:hypothetical protein